MLFSYYSGRESTTATHCCMARSCCSRREAQNNVAWVICQQRRPQTRLLLKSLHWLPVQQRIQYKITVITHKALSTSIPPYMDELLHPQVMTRSLRSTDTPRRSVPWTRTETAKRVFCVAAPNVWNSLPNNIRNASSLSSFRAKLKTKHTFYCCILVMTYQPPRLCIDFLLTLWRYINLF